MSSNNSTAGTRRHEDPAKCQKEEQWFAASFLPPDGIQDSFCLDSHSDNLRAFQDMIWNFPSLQIIPDYGSTPEDLAALCGDGVQGRLPTSLVTWVVDAVNKQQDTSLCICLSASSPDEFARLVSRRNRDILSKLIFVADVEKNVEDEDDINGVFLGAADRPGHHWVLITLELTDHPLIQYCDSAGWNCPHELLPVLSTYTQHMGLPALKDSDCHLVLMHTTTRLVGHDHGQHVCTTACLNYPVVQKCDNCNVCGLVTVVCLVIAAFDHRLFSLLTGPRSGKVTYLHHPTRYQSWLRRVMMFWLARRSVDLSVVWHWPSVEAGNGELSDHSYSAAQKTAEADATNLCSEGAAERSYCSSSSTQKISEADNTNPCSDQSSTSNKSAACSSTPQKSVATNPCSEQSSSSNKSAACSSTQQGIDVTNPRSEQSAERSSCSSSSTQKTSDADNTNPRSKQFATSSKSAACSSTQQGIDATNPRSEQSATSKNSAEHNSAGLKSAAQRAKDLNSKYVSILPKVNVKMQLQQKTQTKSDLPGTKSGNYSKSTTSDNEKSVGCVPRSDIKTGSDTKKCSSVAEISKANKPQPQVKDICSMQCAKDLKYVRILPKVDLNLQNIQKSDLPGTNSGSGSGSKSRTDDPNKKSVGHVSRSDIKTASPSFAENSTADKPKPQICPFCNMQLGSHQALYKHKCRKHKAEMSETPTTTETKICPSVAENSKEKNPEMSETPTTKTKNSKASKSVPRICPLCNGHFASRQALHAHKKRKHKGAVFETLTTTKKNCPSMADNSKTSKSTREICPFCNSQFASCQALHSHKQRMHGAEMSETPTTTKKNCPSMAENSKASKYVPRVCPLCNITFSSRQALHAHKKRKHKGAVFEPASTKRSLCVCQHCPGVSCLSIRHLIAHHNSVHGQSMEVRSKSFKNEEEFLAWKKQVEKDTASQYYRIRNTKRYLNRTVAHYYCNRSGTYKPSVSGSGRKKALKSQGSRKMGYNCTAFIKVYQKKSSGSELQLDRVKVVYCLEHTGHSRDLKHLNISDELRSVVVGKLQEGVEIQTILDDIRNSVTHNTRDSLIRRADILNIKKQYNIVSVVRHHHEPEEDNETGWQAPPLDPENRADVEKLRSDCLKKGDEIVDLIKNTEDVSVLQAIDQLLDKALATGREVQDAVEKENTERASGESFEPQRHSSSSSKTKRKRKASKLQLQKPDRCKKAKLSSEDLSEKTDLTRCEIRFNDDDSHPIINWF